MSLFTKYVAVSSIKLEDVDAMSDEEIANLTSDDHAELERLRNEKINKNKQQIPETSAQDLRTQVLSHAIPAIEKVQESLNTGKTLEPAESQAYQMLWPIIENLISKTEDLKIIEATNAKDVLNSVSKGKITMAEGLSLMALLKDQVTIDELPNLIARLNESEK